MFKTPAFWYRKDGQAPSALEKLLEPLSSLYLLAHGMRQRARKPAKFPVSVICIGNLNAGGAGKTPSAIALMRVIKENGLARNPFFISRGYGGRERGPLRVDPSIHRAGDTGDESLLLSESAPTVIARDRPAGISLAVHEDADLILMDDGLQNPSVHKDIKIIVIDGEMGFGNGKPLPAGPLREKLDEGLAPADAFIFIGEDARGTRALLPPGKPVFTASRAADQSLPRDIKYLAFAGIGYPEKFFASLRAQGFDVCETRAYPDHYPYKEKDIDKLVMKARALNAELLTTEKDIRRIPAKNHDEIRAFHAPLQFPDEESVISFLKSKISSRA